MVSTKGLGSRNLGRYVSPSGFSCRSSLLNLLGKCIDHYELLCFSYEGLEKWSLRQFQQP